MAWQKGDLGRFKSEDASQPRFEVLGMSEDRSVVHVWYNAEPKSSTIPFATFKADCVNWWATPAEIPPMPAWIRPGTTFSFDGHVVKAILPERLSAPSARARFHRNDLEEDIFSGSVGYAPFPKSERAERRHERFQGELTIRSIRKDFASCMVGKHGKLLILPVSAIAKNGVFRVSVWDILRSDDDDFDEPEDEVAQLLRGA